MKIRAMKLEDYDQVYKVWGKTEGFGIRNIDDSRDGIERFLNRNPGLSAVAEQDGIVVGSILCGHDGRCGSFYHVCVVSEYRKQGIAAAMEAWCLEQLAGQGINQVILIAFKDNQVGNKFWKQKGWYCREDVNYYQMVLNEENKTKFVMNLRKEERI